MSRDPEDGQLNDPKTLHKYLYAGGDPINAIDPTGRDSVWEYAGFAIGYTVARVIVPVAAFACAVDGIWQAITVGTELLSKHFASVKKVKPPPPNLDVPCVFIAGAASLVTVYYGVLSFWGWLVTPY
jgi:hypothetical protein